MSISISKLKQSRIFMIFWLLLSISVTLLIMERFHVGVPGQTVPCLDKSYFIIDLKNKNVHRGDYVAFKSLGLEPYFKDNSTFVKLYAASPGDRVVIKKEGTIVYFKEGGHSKTYPALDLMSTLNKPASEFEKEIIIPDGELFVLGTKPRTYDSKYWGTIKQEQVVGKAYGIY